MLELQNLRVFLGNEAVLYMAVLLLLLMLMVKVGGNNSFRYSNESMQSSRSSSKIEIGSHTADSVHPGDNSASAIGDS